MMQAQASLIAGGRLHLHHGPIDLIIGVEPEAQRSAAFEAAFVRFQTILQELTEELPLLRAPVDPTAALPSGQVARRMFDACRPLASLCFVTPMAAVAGAVAEEVLAAMTRATRLERAYVNNGGDIALHVSPGAEMKTAIMGLNGAELGRITLGSDDGIAGIATSGQGGRSLSLGIADSVTVLAATAARADVAATLIANAVDLPGHAAIRRSAASHNHPDSDLGDQQIVTHVGPLHAQDVSDALFRGQKRADTLLASGQIRAAHLSLRGQSRMSGSLPIRAPSKEELAHA